MSNTHHATVSLPFEDAMKTFLLPVDPVAFDAAYPQDRVLRIHTAFKATVRGAPRHGLGTSGTDAPNSDVYLEEPISEAWRALDKDDPLCQGYVLNLAGNHAMQVGALISLHDKDFIDEEGLPNCALVHLAIVFGPEAHTASVEEVPEADTASRTAAQDRLLSFAERVFLVQHRTALFMLLVNGDQFRVIRWDRSGCIVTEALNYVQTVEGTRRLLRFLYAYSQSSPERRGFDSTATRLSKRSCGWRWMHKVAMAHPDDLDHTDGADIGSVPQGFATTPTRNAPPSPLFTANILSLDPRSAASGLPDLSSGAATAPHIIPVFRYVRDLFRRSIQANWPCYALKVCSGYYLIGKPISEPHGLVGRGTRGYVALEWSTQRLVFLKDTWRPFHHDVEREGTTLENLNKAGVSFVPTLICHEDVGGPRRQETVVSRCMKKSDVFGEQEKNKNLKDRPIALMPLHPKGSWLASSSRTPQKQKTSSVSNEQPAVNMSNPHFCERSSRKRTRPPDTVLAPVVALQDGPGLRRLTHYRIVVAEVCLPSTAITRGEQLARVIWHCVIAHRDAAVDCSILHRDVSSGNILILPRAMRTGPERGQWGVLWLGILCDWELAQPFNPTVQVKSSALQTRRTGTWYFMSVYCQTRPERGPLRVSIADELESFFHVLLYLAVRLLRTTLVQVDVPRFVDTYFASSEQDHLGRGPICGALKQAIVRSGELEWHGVAIHFLSRGSESGEDSEVKAETARLTPLNALVARFLASFSARYAVLRYEAREQTHSAKDSLTPRARPVPPQARPRESTNAPVDVARARRLNAALMQAKGKLSGATASSRLPDRSIIQRPSDVTYRLAAELETHDSVLALFEEFGSLPWPTDDYAGDQLQLGGMHNSHSQESHSEAKRARLDGRSTSTSTSTMQETHEI